MSKYLKEPDSKRKPIASDYFTTADDQSRLIWYGVCGMWTDDWDNVSEHGVPHCKECGAPGFQATAQDWFDGAKNHEAEHPGYVDALLSRRSKCPKKNVLQELP